jgi:hypothetical protein
MSEDLWGEISVEKEIKLPVTTLKEQATLLGEKTNKILEGSVTPIKYPDKDIVGFSLSIIAPALGNYRYKVLSISHKSIFVYPLTVSYRGEDGVATSYTCEDEGGFNDALKEILSSERVHKAIGALISQSKATTA